MRFAVPVCVLVGRLISFMIVVGGSHRTSNLAIWFQWSALRTSCTSYISLPECHGCSKGIFGPSQLSTEVLWVVNKLGQELLALQ